MTNYCKTYLSSEDTITFENVLTDEVKTVYIDNPFDDIQYQKDHNIMVSGDYVDKHLINHIMALMNPNEQGTQFTHIFIYYVCDGVVDCSVNLNTFALSLDMITDFVTALITCADPDRINEFTFEFTRPNYDCTEFAIETSR